MMTLDNIRYIGLLVSNNYSNYCEDRIHVTCRAYYYVQNAGICSSGVKLDSAQCVYNYAIRPVCNVCSLMV